MAESQEYNVVPLFETVVDIPAEIETTVEGETIEVNTAFDQSTTYVTTIIEGNWDQVLSVNGKTGDVWVSPQLNDYQPGTKYTKGEAIVVDGKIYRARQDIASAPDPIDLTQWEEVDTVDAIMPNFKANYAYEKYEFIAMNGRIYRARNSFVSTDVFNEADWEWVRSDSLQEFRPNAFYYANDIVRYNGSIYFALSDGRTATISPANWQKIATATAENVDYDNTDSGLVATNVQDAIDELKANADDFESEATAAIEDLDDRKVDKVEGKGLSTNDFTNDLKSKLDGIAAGAEVNVQADWNETSTSSDAYIKNKPAPYVLPQATADTLGGIKAANKVAKDVQEVHIDPTTGRLVVPQIPEGEGIVSVEVTNTGHLIITLGNGTQLDSGQLPTGVLKRQTVGTMDGTNVTYTINPAVDPDHVVYITINGVDYDSSNYTINSAGNQITTNFAAPFIPEGKLELILSYFPDEHSVAPRFTNSVAGLFLGSAVDGEVGTTGRGDGTGKVNGWSNLVNTVNGKENSFGAGTTAQYLRGDKTWQTLNKSAVGLSNVDNTSDATKKANFTGQIDNGNTGFVTGDMVYDYVTDPSILNQRADWDETDTTSYSYINNKPAIVDLVLSTNDIGEGANLPANTLYGVYEDS